MSDLLLGLLLGALGVPLSRWTDGMEARRRELVLVYLVTSAAAVPVLALAALELLGIVEFPYGAAEPGLLGLLGVVGMMLMILAMLWACLAWPWYLVTAVRFRREPRLLVPVAWFLAADLVGLAIVLEVGGAAAAWSSLGCFVIYALTAGAIALGEVRALRADGVG